MSDRPFRASCQETGADKRQRPRQLGVDMSLTELA